VTVLGPDPETQSHHTTVAMGRVGKTYEEALDAFSIVLAAEEPIYDPAVKQMGFFGCCWPVTVLARANSRKRGHQGKIVAAKRLRQRFAPFNPKTIPPVQGLATLTLCT
jgi:hypothetical protein